MLMAGVDESDRVPPTRSYKRGSPRLIPFVLGDINEDLDAIPIAYTARYRRLIVGQTARGRMGGDALQPVNKIYFAQDRACSSAILMEALARLLTAACGANPLNPCGAPG